MDRAYSSAKAGLHKWVLPHRNIEPRGIHTDSGLFHLYSFYFYVVAMLGSKENDQAMEGKQASAYVKHNLRSPAKQ